MKKLIVLVLLLVGICSAEREWVIDESPNNGVIDEGNFAILAMPEETQYAIILSVGSYDIYISTPYIAVNAQTGLKVELPAGTTLYLKRGNE